jgi:tetratricopeptide (TPR) repeat protein
MNVRMVALPGALLLVAVVAAAMIDRPVDDDPPPADAPPTKPLNPAESPDREDESAAETSTNVADYVYTPAEAIKLFELRVKANPKDHASLAILGDLYESQGRETHDGTWFARAEVALRKTLELFPEDLRAKVSLAVVLCDRHKFAEALELAQSVLIANPQNIDALATAGDAQLELGRYTEAEQSLRALVRRLPDSAPALARLAHLEELKGRTDDALTLDRRAIEVLRKAGATAETLAWYQLREADLLFNAGRVEEAGKVAEAVVSAVPAHSDAIVCLARVRAAQGRTSEAIALYEKAAGISTAPSILIALADLYDVVGDKSRARANRDLVQRAISGQPEYRRLLSVFYADHDRELPLAVELARQDLLERQDIYGHDALAWALFKNGQPEEASRSITEALKLGTRDARLFYHAGMIYHRLRDPSKAHDYLGRALALNPHFSPRDAAEARRTSAELEPLDTLPARTP